MKWGGFIYLNIDIIYRNRDENCLNRTISNEEQKIDRLKENAKNMAHHDGIRSYKFTEECN